MSREFPEWGMDNETRTALDAQISGGMFGGIPEPQTPEDVRALESRYGKNAVIAAIAGTLDKASRAWKSARDGLSRRRAGRVGIGEAWRGKFNAAARAGRMQAARAAGRMSVSLTADIRTSRTWDRGRKMSADLTGSDLAAYLDALADGQYEHAAMVVAEAYGIDPDVIVEIANIAGFEADIEDIDTDE
ncbi:MAG TPA: hypothetical protein VG674_31960 [Amycolatopsis sp.]|nr:hypothetical protein [Amycolatopsis sp.]